MANDMQQLAKASFYFGGAKLGVAQKGTLKIQGNDEEMPTDDGISYTDGTLASQVHVDTISTEDGQDGALLGALLNKKILTVQVVTIAGKQLSMKMKCLNADFSMEFKSGALTGGWDFGGGKPTAV